MARNPTRVVEALTAAGVTVAGIALREFTVGTYLVLQKIESPLVMREPGEIQLSDLQVVDLLFVLSRSPVASNALLAQGRAAFDAAVIEFAGGIRMADLPSFESAIRDLMQRASSTAPGEPGGAEKKTSSTSPPEAPGSAGR